MLVPAVMVPRPKTTRGPHATVLVCVLLTTVATGMPVGIVFGGTGQASPVAAPVPKVSEEPAVQQWIETQLARAAAVRLNPNARVASLTLTEKPLREILDALANAGAMNFRYAAGISLDAPTTVALSDSTIEDALRAVLERHALTFQAMGPKTAFIYPDTPANRVRYTASVRVFPIAKADPMVLAQQLNRSLKATADDFRAMVLTVADSRTIIVRAVPELVAWIATWITENDKDTRGAGRAISHHLP